ncbi:MAG TPA: filamentous hemagglutinin family protein, partial [Methylosinus sp.]
DGDDTPFSGCAGAAISCQTAAWVNYGTFFQNFGALGGGDITLRAGGDITDVSASLPQTLIVAGGFTAADPAHALYFGGGNLLVQSGGDLNSSAFLVGRGAGRIEVGGAVQQTLDNPITEGEDAAPYPLLLAAQNGYISVVAKGDLTLGALIDPMTTRQNDQPSFVQSLTPNLFLPGADETSNFLWGSSFTGYGAQAGLSLTSLSGDVSAMTVVVDNSEPSGPGVIASSTLLPPNLAIAALQGSIDIGSGGRRMMLAYPTDNAGHDSASLTLAAAGSIDVALDLDAPPAAALGSGANASAYVNPLGLPSYTLAPSTLTTSDPVLVSAGIDLDGSLSVDRPAQIRVGRDVGSEVFTFTGVNFTDADVTSVTAGRDIGGIYHLYGPGALLVEAGRNIRKPLDGASTNIFSIYTIGNGSGSVLADGFVPTLHSYLPDEGASIYLRYGVANGVDYAAAIARYVDPASAGVNGVDFLAYIAERLGQSREEAWTTFQSLSTTRKQLLVDEAFLSLLTQVATDYRDPTSPYYLEYARAYEAVGVLFPTSRGYANDGSGGADASAVGRLVMPYSLVETQAGGDINILGPVGGIRVGSAGRDTLRPDQEGILTLRGGAIRIYTDQTVLVNQSRIMTQQGGNVEIFSGNGDIDAGSGPKTYVANPVLSEVCDYSTGYCGVNPQGLVTGAGIGAIVTLPTQDPSRSNAILSAPRGTVDAGAAGIRVGGNLTIVAQRINNAYNIQVQGNVSGLPTVSSAVNIGAMTSASSAAGAAAKTVDTPRAGNAGS